MEKRFDGPTPNGGVYTIIYYFNERGEDVSPEEATNGIGCEFDENGKLLNETYLTFNNKNNINKNNSTIIRN